jgi:hypothetical protein
LGIGEIVDGGGTGRRDIDDTRIRQGVLESEPRAAMLRWGKVAPLLPPAAFCMAWLSSKMITPSKSEPNHSTICLTRETFSPRSSDRSVA